MEIITIIVVSLIFSALFSGLEIAFVTSNKFKIELDKNKGTLSGKILSYFAKRPSRIISTMLIGNNIALVIYGIFMARLLEPIIEQYISSSYAVLIIETILSTLLILVTAEFLPKTLFRINPNSILKFFSGFIYVIYKILSPIVFVILALSKFLIKNILKIEFIEVTPVFGRIDLDNFLKDVISGSIKEDDEIEHEIQIFQNALEFNKVRLRECIVPRTEIIAVEINESLEELKKVFINTHHSRVLIFKENIDNIIGFVDCRAMFHSHKNIKSILNPIIVVPESMLASNLLERFLEQRKDIALVVDEYGGTSGIVTIEDVMEEIFGEIEDEHDTTSFVDEQISENEFIFSGRLEIDYVNEKYNLNIPESEDYETLAGYITYNYENIPKRNEEIEINGFVITILIVSVTKIEKVKLRVAKEN